MLDLKVQVRTERINDRDWTRYIGGGVGVGLRLPWLSPLGSRDAHLYLIPADGYNERLSAFR